MKKQHDYGNQNGGFHGNLKQTGTADDAHRNRPEQKRQIHGVFYRSPETDDGQRTHHAKRDYNAGLNGDDDGGGDHGNHRQGNGEGLGIEGFPADGTVDHENVRADQGGEDQRSYDGRGREVRIELVQKRFF